MERCMVVGWLMGLASAAGPFLALLFIHLKLRKKYDALEHRVERRVERI